MEYGSHLLRVRVRVRVRLGLRSWSEGYG